MSHRGASLVVVNPYGIGVGPLGKHRLSLRGLGQDTTDYGLAARQAALDRDRQDRLNRLYEQQDTWQRQQEREKILSISQEAVQKARGAQVDILTAGQNQMRRLLFAGSGIAIVALGAITLSSIFVSRKGRKRRRSSSRSRRRPVSRRSSRRAASPVSIPSSIGVVA